MPSAIFRSSPARASGATSCSRLVMSSTDISLVAVSMIGGSEMDKRLQKLVLLGIEVAIEVLARHTVPQGFCGFVGEHLADHCGQCAEGRRGEENAGFAFGLRGFRSGGGIGWLLG